jgi:hypothetical protein
MAALVVLVLGPLSAARADESTLAILSPAANSSIANHTPTFSGTTNGTGNPVTVAIYAGGSVAPVQESVVAPSEGAWSLTLTAALAEGTYTAVATEPSELTEPNTSPPVIFTIDGEPVIATNPTSETVRDGEAASFLATASGTPTPSVQWQVSIDGGSHWNPLPGAVANVLTFTTVAAYNGYEFRAVFANTVGEVISQVATLTVETEPPVVTTSPASATVVVGHPATFTAAASGLPTPEVQWQVSTNGGAGWSNLPGATEDSLTIVTTAEENGNKYRAVFTNSVSKATSEAATLTVETLPVVTSSPANRSLVAGQVATFTASAVGLPTPEVQWQVSTNGGAGWSNLPGATEATLTFTTTAQENGNEYRALFTNLVGSVPSATAKLTVETAPVVTKEPTSTSVVAGENARFTASAVGVPTPTVQWQVSTNLGSTWANDTSDSGNATGTLTVAHATLADNGRRYRAVFSNGIHPAATTAEATLTVAAKPEPPAVRMNPEGVRVKVGEPATFTAEASGVPTPHVQWEVSTNLGSTWAPDTTDSGSTTDTLTVAGTAGVNGYTYRAIFTNEHAGEKGTATSAPATLIVESPPPSTQASSPVSSSTATAGDPPAASFAWFPPVPHTGEPVSLASNSTAASSAITAFAWDLEGGGIFAAGGPVMTTSFSTTGKHVVQLRVTNAEGLSNVVAETIPVAAPLAVLLQPFPIVRIAGFDTSFGVELRLLTAQAPVGARVTLICRGRGCPVKQEVRVVASSRSKAGVVLLAFRRFERALRAGIVLEIRIWKPGQVGKYTSFTIRRHRLPLRVDTCLDPTSSKPIACPSS